MTVCIAANCNSGATVVVASDRMLTAPFLTLEFDHPDAKIDAIGKKCVALTSGDALRAQDILEDAPTLSATLQNPTVEQFAETVRQRFVSTRKRVANELLLEPRGMSFEFFYARGGMSTLPSDLALMLDDQIQRIDLGTSIILAGVDASGAHIYSVQDPGTTSCYDRLGYHAIGSGHRHALLALVSVGQHLTTDINNTVFNVYSAKRSAEVAPGVGTATEMRIITQEGTIALSDEDLGKLRPLYDEHKEAVSKSLSAKVSKLTFGASKSNGSRQEKDA